MVKTKTLEREKHKTGRTEQCGLCGRRAEVFIIETNHKAKHISCPHCDYGYIIPRIKEKSYDKTGRLA